MNFLLSSALLLVAIKVVVFLLAVILLILGLILICVPQIVHWFAWKVICVLILFLSVEGFRFVFH
jgi:hypothetical protein